MSQNRLFGQKGLEKMLVMCRLQRNWQQRGHAVSRFAICVNSAFESQTCTEMGQLLHPSLSRWLVSVLRAFPRGAVSLEVSVLQHRQLYMNVPAASELSDVSQQLGTGLCDAASTGLLRASVVGPF